MVAALELLCKAEWEAEQERQRRKQSLLEHYAKSNPKQFVQFDGWWDADECCGRDENGQGVTGNLTWELAPRCGRSRFDSAEDDVRAGACPTAEGRRLD
jgi:hypothetical protein